MAAVASGKATKAKSRDSSEKTSKLAYSDICNSKQTISCEQQSSTKSFIILGAVFCSSLLVLLILYQKFPHLEESEKQYFRLPYNLEDAKQLGRVLQKYSRDHYYNVMSGFLIMYIFLQTFAIPGSIFLSILSGFLFKFPLALLLVCLVSLRRALPPSRVETSPAGSRPLPGGTLEGLRPSVASRVPCLSLQCSSLGACFCYLLSFLVGRPLVMKYFPERVRGWQAHIERHREHFLWYMIFLRITPFLPNWFINITSPMLNVPLTTFFVGTFVGVAPPSVFYINAGRTINKISSQGEIFTYKTWAILMLTACIALLPVLFKRKLKQRFE